MRGIARGLLAAALVAFAATSPKAQTMTLDKLKQAQLQGLRGPAQSITLNQGRWEGPPAQPGAATRPTVSLAEDFAAYGDLDGDGRDEAVVVLHHDPGGSGRFVHLAVFSEHEGQPRHVATALLGDRVQVRDLRIDSGRLVADLVERGADDPACCPSRTVRRSYALTLMGRHRGPGGGARQHRRHGEAGGQPRGHRDEAAHEDRRARLQAVPGSEIAGRLSAADLAGPVWVLTHWRVGSGSADAGEAVDLLQTEAAPTLSLQEGRLTGFTGCNRFQAALSDGAMPGDIKVGAVASTRRACIEPGAEIETRFVTLLPQLQRMQFAPGVLLLTWRTPAGDGGLMRFVRQ